MTEVTTFSPSASLPSPVIGGGEFAFLAMIERAARDPSIDVDKLDRLLQMRERENARVAEQAFNAALADAQTEMNPVAAVAAWYSAQVAKRGCDSASRRRRFSAARRCRHQMTRVA